MKTEYCHRLLTMIALLAATTTATSALSGNAYADAGARFNRIATFEAFRNSSIENDTVAEIVAASEDGRTLIYTDAALEVLGFVDIKNPADPLPLGTLPLDGEPTSVAVRGRYALAAVNTSADFVNVSGYLAIVDIASRRIVRKIALAGQPDSVAVSPDGDYAAIVIENERDEDLGDGAPPQAPPGYLQVLKMKANSINGWSLKTVDLTGIADLYPDDPEPEFVDINRHNIAVVSLQENNHIVLVDLKRARVIRDFSAGTADLDQVDATEEDPALIRQTEQLFEVLREPDAITWIGDHLIGTANEGDLDGGSRSFSIFGYRGQLLYDSGNDLEHLTARIGHYPDSRSGNKGNEPEAIEYARFGRKGYLFVGSERSSVIFVYTLTGRGPEFSQVLPGSVGPEGVLAIPSRRLLVVATEEDSRGDGIRGTIGIYKLGGDATYPTLQSADRIDGTPIPWAALSGLAVDPDYPNSFYSIYDSYFDRSRIFAIDTSRSPALIDQEIELNDSRDLLADVAPQQVNADGSVKLDPEGIAARTDSGFWIASEGAGTFDDLERPITSNNLIIGVTAAGDIDAVIRLPDTLNAVQVRFGFEGVASVRENGGEVLYVAFQRRWAGTGDPVDHVRIGRYDVDAETWTFAYYPIDPPASANGGWVGLSDIAPLGEGRFAVLERDNQAGADAAIKQITVIDVDEVEFSTEPQNQATLPVLTKEVVRDLLPDLLAPKGLVPEKIEGLAVTPSGDAWIVNDNDGVDDNSGETQLIRLPGLFDEN